MTLLLQDMSDYKANLNLFFSIVVRNVTYLFYAILELIKYLTFLWHLTALSFINAI